MSVVTVRLVNTDPRGRAHVLEVPLMRPNVAQFRRRDVPTVITIPANGSVDLCRVLGIDLATARTLAAASPIADYVRSQRLRVIDGVPPPVPPAPVVRPPQAPPLEPPMRNDPPTVDMSPALATVLAARGQALAGLSDEAHAAASPVPSEEDARALVARCTTLGLDLEAMVSVLVRSTASEAYLSPEDRILLARFEHGGIAEVPLAVLLDDASGGGKDVVLATTNAAAWPADEPNTDWKESELRAYARAHDVDVQPLRSKTAVLRAIRGKT